MKWNQEKLEQFIRDRIEESLTLDYKAAASLGRADGKKSEITKDISAFANSAGGLIVYGMAEDPENRHLPQKVDGVSRSDYSKEWLEQVASSIQPRISGLIIHSVQLDTNRDMVVYVVDVPQSSTAHQAKDHRYYRRYNFESVPMTDYEIRDVMSRSQHPKIEVDFELNLESESLSLIPLGAPEESRNVERCYLKVVAANVGNVLAEYVQCFVFLPDELMDDEEKVDRQTREIDGSMHYRYSLQNTHRDVVGMTMSYPKYGPSRFDPILPQLVHHLDSFLLARAAPGFSDSRIYWEAYSDNAAPVVGDIAVSELPFVDNRS